jgi:hypothetical protein
MWTINKQTNLRAILLPIWAVLVSIGIDLRYLRRAFQYRRFIRDYRLWRKLGGSVDVLYPVVGEWGELAGVIKRHYFYQDLLVARLIFEESPERHIDVGSRVDGFVAHVAAFREIEIIDVRNLAIKNRNIIFRRADIMALDKELISSCDSLSCLHAIEHFGLGRYGDSIDPEGYKRGFSNLIRLLRRGGRLYVSFPIGQQRVEYNAHRVLPPADILNWTDADCLELIRFDFIDDSGELHTEDVISSAEKMNLIYGCGIYTFLKIHDQKELTID